MVTQPSDTSIPGEESTPSPRKRFKVILTRVGKVVLAFLVCSFILIDSIEEVVAQVHRVQRLRERFGDPKELALAGAGVLVLGWTLRGQVRHLKARWRLLRRHLRKLASRA